MSPLFSAWVCRILKISSCLRRPAAPGMFISLATWLSFTMLMSFNSTRSSVGVPLLAAWADPCLRRCAPRGVSGPGGRAMQCGAPVIASHAVEEAAGDAAIYADTPRELAGARADLATRPELAAATRQLSLARAREFSWERTARLTRQVYEEARARFGA